MTIEPLHFGSACSPLFGTYHDISAGQGGKDWAVVICSPWGQESLRIHRAMYVLATRLAGSGIPVLRFDYFGCGDSSGLVEEGSMDRWLGDVAAAIEEVQQRSRTTRVALVGVRLGAALALLTAEGRPEVEALMLWDPVVRGATYLEEIQEAHRAWLRGSFAHAAPKAAGPEALGFRIGPELQRQVSRLDLTRIRRCPAEDLLIWSTVQSGAPEPELQLLSQRLRELGVEPKLERRPRARAWVKGDDFHPSLVPSADLRDLERWTTRTLR